VVGAAVPWNNAADRVKGGAGSPQSLPHRPTRGMRSMAVINELDLAPAHFVGLSMGGFIGMRLAARYGDLLRWLTLPGTNADGQDPESAKRFKQLATAYRLLGLSPIRRQVLPIEFGSSFLASPDSTGVTSEWDRRLRRASRAGISRAVRGVADHKSVADELKNITVPALVAVGREDVATPPVQAEGIENAQLEMVAGAGHSSTLE
jgi:3-oxoadipate enol-lactonase